MNRYSLLILLLCSLTIPSCNLFQNNKTKTSKPFSKFEAKPSIETASKEIKEVKDDISQSVDEIKTHTSDISNKANSIKTNGNKDQVETIQDRTYAIEREVETIADKTEKLDMSLKHLSDAKTNIDEMEDATKKAIAAKQEAEQAAADAAAREKDATRYMIRWLIVSSILAGGVAVALVFFGHLKGGLLLGVAAGSVLFLSITLDRYYDYIALGGAVLLGLGAATLVYHMYKREKAIEEVVATTEVTKSKLKLSDRKKIFGHHAEPGLAQNLQSKSTVNIVNRVRQRSKKLWEHTVKSKDTDELDNHTE